MKLRILPYKPSSESGKLLANALGTKRIKPDGDYKYQEGDLIVNLGFSQTPKWDNDNIPWINKPENVRIAVCKKKTFEKLKEKGVAIPDFTTSKETAAGWIQAGHKVVCREILNGHSAQGIVMAHSAAELSNASKLFVKYFPKKKEFRVHVIRDKEGLKIFDFIQKKAKSDIPAGQINYEIRNHGQWIFARDGVDLPNCVKKESVKAVEALGLDLASVDVCYSEKNNNCVVLECNTSSSLSGDTTLENYKNALTKIIKNEKLDFPVIVPAVDKKKDIPGQVAQVPKNPVIPAAPLIPAAQVKVAPAPAVTVSANLPKSAPVQKIINRPAQYNFEGATDISTTIEGKKMKFYGKVAGVSKPVRIMEVIDGEVTYFWQD